MFPNEQILWTIAQSQHQEKIARAQQLALFERGRSTRSGQWRQLTAKASDWLAETFEAVKAGRSGVELADEKL